MAKAETMSAPQVLAILRGHFLGHGGLEFDEWSLLTEVSLPGTEIVEFDNGNTWERKVTRRIDVLLVRNWVSKPNPYERVAIEIKVSRADFFHDSAAKRAPWMAVTNRFVYAVPAGLVTAAEVPDGCSLLEVFTEPITNVAPTHRDFHKQVHWAKTVKRRAATALPEDAWRQGMRRASRAEEQVRRGGDHDAEQVAALVEQLRKANSALKATTTRVQSETARRKETERLVAVVLPQVCTFCGAPLRVASKAVGSYAAWVHHKSDDDASCRAAQLAGGKRWPDSPSPASLADDAPTGTAGT